MKAIKYLFIVCTISIVSFSCSTETANDDPDNLNPTEYYQELNVSYGADSDQKFDIYLPPNRSNTTKVMILIHGGGWSSGDKSDMNAIKDLIRQDLPNIGIVNMNYRLADANNNPYPMQIDDITTVVNHLKDHLDEYVISDDFGFIGISAGAHLSLLWSYGFDTTNNAKMVCSIVGPTNFTDPAYLNNNNPELQALLDLYGVNPTTAFLEEVSPYHRATASSPPTILFYGGQDPLIPTTQGTAMRDKLQTLGVTHEFTLYPNAGHGWVGLELLDTWTKLKLFTQNYLE
ncbi:MAG: alpha/beta hydrolase [Gelidibacter sp.]|nr:alpha/beta hydrolase [Gelidibacter sp.]